jgi:hypothetical protein
MELIEVRASIRKNIKKKINTNLVFKKKGFKG